MKRISLRFRLLVLMICLTTLPVITVTWIATKNTRNSVEKEMINANTSRMMWADQYLNELIEQMDTMFYTLQIDQQLITSFNDMESLDIGVQYKTQNYIKNTLTTSFYANSRKVDDLTLYIHSDQKAFSVNYANSGTISFLNIANGPWSRMQNAAINMYFKQFDKGIYAFHSINRFEDRKLLGGVAVRINRDVWEEVSNILKSESESSVFLMNDEGEILSGSTSTVDSSEIQDQLHRINNLHSELAFERTNQYFFFKKRVRDGQLTIVKAIPLAMVTQSAQPTITAGMLTGSLFAIVSVLISILFSLRITKPIISLARSMRTAQIHNFEMRSVENRDEIGLLEHGYNSMMQRIKELIEYEYQQEIEVKNAQLMALQAQINPHFLHNTLQVMGGMALMKNAPEIYRITQVIGDLLRYSISADGDMVSMDKEIKHMQNYIFIQEQRFVGRCTVRVSVDEAALEGNLPKFTLQPILENAFEHGLQRKEGAWRVEVRISRIGNRIGLMLKDEGVGMTKEQLRQLRIDLQADLWTKEIRSESHNAVKRRGIGMRNVNARLKLQFGRAYSIKIFSQQSVGTLIVMTIPITR